MKTITILFLLFASFACTNPLDVDVQAQRLEGDAGVDVDLWRASTGCLMTPEEFSALPYTDQTTKVFGIEEPVYDGDEPVGGELNMVIVNRVCAHGCTRGGVSPCYRCCDTVTLPAPGGGTVSSTSCNQSAEACNLWNCSQGSFDRVE